ncbi:hypothetical protein EJ02DRAFT_14946 [Clathrospora elynae]|uniref:Uncharacterized protein n=1 Tax=Clathrospora elynae TaxID=706981 RepID=A0A6A5T1B7_9PLEO|nr:hypothetical protein EJ02DRAFT_14946 [Clathrospora elynae]
MTRSNGGVNTLLRKCQMAFHVSTMRRGVLIERHGRHAFRNSQGQDSGNEGRNNSPKGKSEIMLHMHCADPTCTFAWKASTHADRPLVNRTSAARCRDSAQSGRARGIYSGTRVGGRLPSSLRWFEVTSHRSYLRDGQVRDWRLIGHGQHKRRCLIRKPLSQ